MRLFAAIILCFLSISSAAASEKKSRIFVGVIPEVNLVKQMERFVPLSDYLEKKTGMVIDIKPVSNYGQLYEDIRDKRLDAGFFGSFIYGIARARIGVVPVARPVRQDGSSTYSGLLFVRKDSGIKKAADMKGKVIALVDPATTAGYITQKDYLADKGVDVDKDMQIIWTGNHEEAIRAVMSHQAAAGGAKTSIVRKFRRENRLFDTLIEIIDENPKNGVPDNTLAVSKDLEQEKIDALRKALTTMHTDPAGKKVLAGFGALRFISTTDQDYKAFYDLVRHLKIDLKTYPYKKSSP